MKPSRIASTVVLGMLCLFFIRGATAAPATQPSAAQRQFTAMVGRIAEIIEPPTNAKPQTISMRLVLTDATGLPKELAGREMEIAYQAPDRLRVAIEINGSRYIAGRNGNEMWAYDAGRHFALQGVNGVAAFSAMPAELDETKLPPFALPISRTQLALLALAITAEPAGTEAIDGNQCDVLKLTLAPTAMQMLGAKAAPVSAWIRHEDGLPVRFAYADGKVNARVEVRDLKVSAPWPAEKWAISVRDGDRVQRVALSHLTRFLQVLIGQIDNRIPTLGPAKGERRVVATAGKGRLETQDGTRVLFLEGTPREIGYQHGTLMGRQVRAVAERMLWGVGVGTSLPKGTWFFGEIESAQKRVEPFVSKDVLEEMDALSDAARIPRAEGRLANFFPELFHCSGFAVFGDATVGGQLYHGRVLDYLRGMGLEQNAAVIVYRPQGKNAWVNIGYAGFCGSVTAMNEKHISMGEMGGKGQGNWDGIPMAQLVRKVMEESSTLDEAIAIMKNARRTCEYYYVISDGNTRRAVGVCATPEKLELVWPGESHPRLPHPVKDSVLLSAGDRYETLVARVKETYGKLDADGARHLMDRPVCMTSNIQSAMFAPETLDFWVANADSKNVASHTRYTHYNLRKMLDEGSR